MALTVTSGLTEWDDCDTDNWTGDPSVGLDTDFKIEGTGCIGIDVDIETHRMFGAAQTATSLASNYIYAWMFSFTASTLDTKAAGGMQICVEDGSGNQSCWYVGGNDNYTGGWEVFVADTSQTPDWNSGTVATLTNITKFGVGWKNTAKSKLTQNCFVDWMRYGTVPALTITGTNTTTDAGWSEVKSGDDTGVFGIIKQQKGSYILKGPVQIGDSAGTATTNFTDTGTSLVFDDQPVSDTFYEINIVGNATGTTDVRLGSVVGTGDDRQGTQGNSISTLGPAWKWDSQTDIADLDSVKLYGCKFEGAHAGMLFDGMSTVANSSIISCNFVNCGAIETGSTSNGVEMLNSAIIDPDGTTNNYGLQFDQTPSVGVMSTNIKYISFITSGTPTTQYMTVFPYTGDYSVTWYGMNFFGDYSSGTLWHGLNSGTNADVTINVDTASGGNANASEFSNTASGTMTVNNTVTLQVKVVDGNNQAVGTAQTAIYTTTGTQLMNEDTLGTGIATESYNYVSDTAVIIRVRKASTGATKYENFSTTGTITSSGLNVTVVLTEDPNNAT